MAGPYSPPIKGVAWQFHLALQDMANPGSFKSSPTIAAGDFKVSVAGGAFSNLATLPSVDPASSIGVLVAFSAGEMNADEVQLAVIDQTSPKEWADTYWCIQPTSGSTTGVPDVNVKSINSVSASSVTAVNANQGTTQPINFTGTGASALAKSDVIDWNGSAATNGMPMPTYTQPTGFLSFTFPSGTAANTTNITSATGVILGNGAHGGTSSTLQLASATTGTLNITSTLTITGAVSFGSTITATGGTTTLAALTTTGTVTFNAFTVSGATNFTGAFEFGSTVKATAGTMTLGTVNTTGTVTFNAFTITNNFLVSGTTTHTGAVAFGSTFTTGAMTVASLTSTGAVAFQSTWTVTGNVAWQAGHFVTQSSSNQPAVKYTGNGSGAGVQFIGGSTGNGAEFVAAGAGGILVASSGTGIYVNVTTSGNAVLLSPAGDAAGLRVLGAGTRYAVQLDSGSGSIHCLGAVDFDGQFTAASMTLSGALTTGSIVNNGGLTQTGAVSFGSTITATSGTMTLGTINTTGTVTLNALTVTNTMTVDTLTITTAGTIASVGIATRGNITGGTMTTVGTVTSQLTAAQIATGIWQDATAGDFTAASSIGKALYNAFTANTSVFTVAALANAPVTAAGPTASAIATAVWQDTTAGDFTTAGSIGKSLFTSGVVPGASGGLLIAGNNAAATISNVTLVTTTSTNTDMLTATAVWAAAARTLTAGTNIALAKGVGVTGFNDISVSDVWTTALAEAYAADGSTASGAALLYQLWSLLANFSISGTTYTAFRLNGTTSSMTLTLNSATSPTEMFRAT